MDFKYLLDNVWGCFENWKSDEILQEHFMGDDELLKKEFIACIILELNSDSVILTRDELMEKMQDYHSSMEGTDW